MNKIVTNNNAVACSSSEVPLAVVIEGAVYRMYNPNSGEHFCTRSSAERDSLIHNGWNYEANASFATIAADENGAKPVFRVYNPNSGLHHYTMNHEEVILLKAAGWNYEGVAWNVK